MPEVFLSTLLKYECPNIKLSRDLGDNRLLILVQYLPATLNALSESVESEVDEIYGKVDLYCA